MRAVIPGSQRDPANQAERFMRGVYWIPDSLCGASGMTRSVM